MPTTNQLRRSMCTSNTRSEIGCEQICTRMQIRMSILMVDAACLLHVLMCTSMYMQNISHNSPPHPIPYHVIACSYSKEVHPECWGIIGRPGEGYCFLASPWVSYGLWVHSEFCWLYNLHSPDEQKGQRLVEKDGIGSWHLPAPWICWQVFLDAHH